MKFHIRRGSAHGLDEVAPCDGAERHDEGWTIEVSTIGELLDLCARTDELIVSPKGRSPSDTGPLLTIYDDYLE